jgi:hypothetical protein
VEKGSIRLLKVKSGTIQTQARFTPSYKLPTSVHNTSLVLHSYKEVYFHQTCPLQKVEYILHEGHEYKEYLQTASEFAVAFAGIGTGGPQDC